MRKGREEEEVVLDGVAVALQVHRFQKVEVFEVAKTRD
jgi:hypothetical protein